MTLPRGSNPAVRPVHSRVLDFSGSPAHVCVHRVSRISARELVLERFTEVRQCVMIYDVINIVDGWVDFRIVGANAEMLEWF
jgi:hypothetical protein